MVREAVHGPSGRGGWRAARFIDRLEDGPCLHRASGPL